MERLMKRLIGPTTGNVQPLPNSADNHRHKLGPAAFNKVRARFMARVSAPERSPFALKLAYIIAFKRMNRDTQVLFIGLDELAKELGTNERTVRRMLPTLRACGLQIERGDGRGHANAYWFAAEAERGTPKSTFKGAKGGHLRPVKVDTKVHPILRKNSKCEVATQLHTGERDGAAALPPRDPPAGGPEGSRAVSKQVTAHNAAADRFDELRAVWTRPWTDDDAADRQAFKEACRSTAPGVIITAAALWVKAADAPRFLPSLEKWLTARSWEKPPPKKHQHKAAGRRGRGKRDLAKVFFEKAGWVEDEDGSLTDPETGRTLQ